MPALNRRGLSKGLLITGVFTYFRSGIILAFGKVSPHAPVCWSGSTIAGSEPYPGSLECSSYAGPPGRGVQLWGLLILKFRIKPGSVTSISHLESLYKYFNESLGFRVQDPEMHLESDRGAPPVSCAVSTVSFLLSR